jgi:hypothetical protein
MLEVEDLRVIKEMTKNYNVQEVLNKLCNYIFTKHYKIQLENIWYNNFENGEKLKGMIEADWIKTIDSTGDIKRIEDIEADKVYETSYPHSLEIARINFATMEKVKMILDEIEEIISK